MVARSKFKLFPLIFLILFISNSTNIRSEAEPKTSFSSSSNTRSQATTQSPSDASIEKGRIVIKFTKDALRSAITNSSVGTQSIQSKLAIPSKTNIDKVFFTKYKVSIKPLFQQTSSNVASSAKLQTRQQKQKAEAVKDISQIYVLEFDTNADVKAMLKDLDPLVKEGVLEYAEPDYVYEANIYALPNDEFVSTPTNTWKNQAWGQQYPNLWGLKNIKADKAWSSSNKGKGVIVAVVDSGVDYTHKDIADNIWKNLGEDINGDRKLDENDRNGKDDDRNGFVDDFRGWNVFSSSNDVMDDNGHGTHVAGTIAAIGDNQVGVIGVAPMATIMPIKGLNNKGSGVTSALASGIIYAANNGAKIINNSWGSSGRVVKSNVVEDAIKFANAQDAVVVFAAGNSADDVQYYSPQNVDRVLVVGSVDENNRLSSFSSFGYEVDVVAPGGGGRELDGDSKLGNNVLSLKTTWPTAEFMDPKYDPVRVGDQYIRLRGTSMAAPHVSGLAALIRSRKPELTNFEVMEIIKATTNDLGDSGKDFDYGHGMIDCERALSIDQVPSVAIMTPNEKDVITPNTREINVVGRAFGKGFKSFQLFYRDVMIPNKWIPIGALRTQPIEDGILGTIKNPFLYVGLFEVKLEVTTVQGIKFTAYKRFVVEDNPIRVTKSNEAQYYPVITNKLIAWMELRSSSKGEVYGWDLLTRKEILLDDAKDLNEDYIANGTNLFFNERVEKLYWFAEKTNSEVSLFSLSKILNSKYVKKSEDALFDTNCVRLIGHFETCGDYNSKIRTIDVNNLGLRVSPYETYKKNNDVYIFDKKTGYGAQITAHPKEQHTVAARDYDLVWRDARDGLIQFTSYNNFIYYQKINTPKLFVPQEMNIISGKEVLITPFVKFNQTIKIKKLSVEIVPSFNNLKDSEIKNFTLRQNPKDQNQYELTFTPTHSQQGIHTILYKVELGNGKILMAKTKLNVSGMNIEGLDSINPIYNYNKDVFIPFRVVSTEPNYKVNVSFIKNGVVEIDPATVNFSLFNRENGRKVIYFSPKEGTSDGFFFIIKISVVGENGGEIDQTIKVVFMYQLNISANGAKYSISQPVDTKMYMISNTDIVNYIKPDSTYLLDNVTDVSVVSDEIDLNTIGLRLDKFEGNSILTGRVLPSKNGSEHILEYELNGGVGGFSYQKINICDDTPMLHTFTNDTMTFSTTCDVKKIRITLDTFKNERKQTASISDTEDSQVTKFITFKNISDIKADSLAKGYPFELSYFSPPFSAQKSLLLKYNLTVDQTPIQSYKCNFNYDTRWNNYVDIKELNEKNFRSLYCKVLGGGAKIQSVFIDGPEWVKVNTIGGNSWQIRMPMALNNKDGFSFNIIAKDVWDRTEIIHIDVKSVNLPEGFIDDDESTRIALKDQEIIQVRADNPFFDIPVIIRWSTFKEGQLFFKPINSSAWTPIGNKLLRIGNYNIEWDLSKVVNGKYLLKFVDSYSDRLSIKPQELTVEVKKVIKTN